MSSQLPIDHVRGNVSDEIKRVIAHPYRTLWQTLDKDGTYKWLGFSAAIFERIVVTDVSVESDPNEPSRRTGKVVCELHVLPDMVNYSHNLHGGCTAFLVDMCSGLVLIALAMHNGASKDSVQLSVSQSLNVLYYSPAPVGDKLRIINTTISLGSRVLTAKTDIYNESRHRLVASGTQTKMQQSVKL